MTDAYFQQTRLSSLILLDKEAPAIFVKAWSCTEKELCPLRFSAMSYIVSFQLVRCLGIGEREGNERQKPSFKTCMFFNIQFNQTPEIAFF